MLWAAAPNARTSAAALEAFADRLAREAEMLGQCLGRRRLAVAVDADREAVVTDDALPPLGDTRFDRHAAPPGRQERAAERLVLAQEELGARHRHDPHVQARLR